MAGKLPHIQFYPGDWLRDGVAGCSLAAQGLWLRMMFVAHDSDRYGYLEMNGSPMPPATIARRCGCDLAEYEPLLSELVRAGVPSSNDAGTLFSRRMVRDATIRQKRACAGRKGGKQSGKQRRSKREAKHEQNPDSDNDVANAFEVFWKVFPSGRKKSKGRARAEFLAAVQKHPPLEIVAAARDYAASSEGQGQFVKMPSTWLKGECWNDDRAAWGLGRDGDPRGTMAVMQKYLEGADAGP